MSQPVQSSSKLVHLWKDLVQENPMLIEIHRFRRRYLTFSGGNTLNSAILAIVLVSYAGLILVVFSGKGNFPPLGIVMFQAVLITIFAPGMLHGAIAGERERRSWELLLVAPISNAQIVFGKFLGALAALGVAFGFLFVPIMFAAVTYLNTNWADLFQGELVSITFAVAICAFTLLISARVRRPFVALGVTLGSLAMILIVIPGMLSSLVGNISGAIEDEIWLLNPIYVLAKLLDHRRYDYGGAYDRGGLSNHVWGWPQIGVYLALSAVLLRWGVLTLKFAENDVKFLPKGQKEDA